jgi:two-component system cell cycle response regulator
MPARILIVEDNSQNLELMRYLLAAHGYEVLTAMDGAAAIEVLAHAQPDLILSDIQMPRMDGFDLIKWLRARAPMQTIPMVAVTALAMVGDRDRILAAGFDGYLSKPISPETFVREVIAYLPPNQRAPPLHPAQPAPQATRIPATGRLVLVVDDLQSNLDLAQVVLEHLGYRTLQAKGLQQALHRLDEATPELILSDVHMREGGGMELLQAVRNNPALRDVPFVLLTSTAANERDRLKGLALGATRYLYRPIEPDVLRAELAACLAERKVRP